MPRYATVDSIGSGRPARRACSSWSAALSPSWARTRARTSNLSASNCPLFLTAELQPHWALVVPRAGQHEQDEDDGNADEQAATAPAESLRDRAPERGLVRSRRLRPLRLRSSARHRLGESHAAPRAEGCSGSDAASTRRTAVPLRCHAKPLHSGRSSNVDLSHPGRLSGNTPKAGHRGRRPPARGCS